MEKSVTLNLFQGHKMFVIPAKVGEVLQFC